MILTETLSFSWVREGSETGALVQSASNRSGASNRCARSFAAARYHEFRFQRRFLKSLTTIFIAICLGWLPIESLAIPAHPWPFVNASEILRLAVPSHSTTSSDSYQQILKLAFDDLQFKANDILAFEENRFFTYAVGVTSKVYGRLQEDRMSQWIRRFIFLKPSTFVVEDEIVAPASAGPVQWALYSHSMPEVAGLRARIIEEEGEILFETLLPEKASLVCGKRQASGEKHVEDQVLRIAAQGKPARVRFLHVFHVRARGDNRSAARSELVVKDGKLDLTVSTEQRVFQLTLPPARIEAGDIAISKTEGKILLAHRPLASGILPHGVEGMRMLERWDVDYRDGHRPLWDAGRPSSELKRVVEDGTIRACRVVELGCGSGTDAIYLASQGFNVTAIDIAPTALSQAQEKAHKAGVQVRWLVVDVLAPPDLGPFDFIYDRGCYHEVREQNLAAYLETVCRFSHPGTRFLVLAGNANEMVLNYGPPRLTEEELRDDFSPLFDFEWIRESRFEISNSAQPGPLAWSVLLRRKH